MIPNLSPLVAPQVVIRRQSWHQCKQWRRLVRLIAYGYCPTNYITFSAGPPSAPYKFAVSVSFLPAMKYHGVKMSKQVIVMASNLDDKVSQSESFFVSMFCMYGVLYQLPFIHLGLAVISVIETGMSSFRGNFHHCLHQQWWNQGQKFRQNDFSVSSFHLIPLPT